LSTRDPQRDGLYGFPWVLLQLGRAGGGRACGVLSVWLGWEKLTTWWWRLRPVRAGGLFLYRLTRHGGAPISLSDGTIVQPGDLVLDLHFDNRSLLRLVGTGDGLPWGLMHVARQDLLALAEAAAREELPGIRAIHGVTLFAPAGRRLGFEVRPLPRTLYWALVRFFMLGLLAVYHPAGRRRLNRRAARLWPGEVWMSRSALVARQCRSMSSASGTTRRVTAGP
jgi:hypothetical protein